MVALYYNNKAHVEVTNGSSVLNNVASTDGGAFYTIGIPQINTPTTLWVYDSTVSGNVATNGSGGAVFADTDQLEFIGSTVSNNRAAISGGAQSSLLPPQVSLAMNYSDLSRCKSQVAASPAIQPVNEAGQSTEWAIKSPATKQLLVAIPPQQVVRFMLKKMNLG